MHAKNALSPLGLVLFLVVSFSLSADDWPQLGGPGRDGVWPGPVFAQNRPAGLEVEERWRVPIGSGYSGIAVVGGRLFTMASDGSHDLVIAFDAASGAELWRVPVDATYPGGSGSVGGPLSTPAVANGTVFAMAPRGHLVALATEDGKVRWRRDLAADFGAVEPEYGMTASPLVDGQRVVVMAGGDKAYVVALDSTTGELVWSETHGAGTSYASPLKVQLAGVEQIVVPSGESLYAVDPRDGSLLWSHSVAGLGLVDRMPLVLPGDRLFLPLSSGGLMLAVMATPASSAEPGPVLRVEELWRTPRLAKSTHAPPIYHDGHLYGMNGSLLVCISADDGAIRWRTRLYDGTLILVDGYLIVMSAGSGKLHIVEASPERFEEVSELSLLDVGFHTVTPPSYADQTVFVRNVHEMTALTLRPSAGQPAHQDPEDVASQTASASPSTTRLGDLDSEWPQWLGPFGNRRSSATGIFSRRDDLSLRELWRLPLDVGVEPSGEAGLAVAGGRVFTLVSDGATEEALAIDASNGEVLWRTVLDPKFEGADAGPVSTPAVASDRVFTLSSECRLRALAAKDGTILWLRDLKAELGAGPLRFGCRTSPHAVDDKVVVQVSGEKDNRVVALRQRDGGIVWTSAGLDRSTYTSPVSAVLGGVPQVLIHAQTPRDGRTVSLLYSIGLERGEVLWSFRAAENVSWVTPYVLDDQRVLLSTWSHAYMLRPPSERTTMGEEIPEAQEVWRVDPLESPAYAQGHLYGFSNTDLMAIDATTGEVRWSEKIFWGTAILVDGQLITLSYNTGLLRIVDASHDGYRERARLQVFNPGALNRVPPSFAAGTIFVRNQEEIVAVVPMRRSVPR